MAIWWGKGNKPADLLTHNINTRQRWSSVASIPTRDSTDIHRPRSNHKFTRYQTFSGIHCYVSTRRRQLSRQPTQRGARAKSHLQRTAGGGRTATSSGQPAEGEQTSRQMLTMAEDRSSRTGGRSAGHLATGKGRWRTGRPDPARRSSGSGAGSAPAEARYPVRSRAASAAARGCAPA